MVKASTALRAFALASIIGAASIVAVTQTSDLKEEYVAVLAQIEDAKLRIGQQEVFVAQQNERIDFLRGQIAKVPEITVGVEDMMSKAVSQADSAINTDVPFLLEERRNRIGKLQDDIASEDMPVGEKYRRVLAMLKIEAEYGMSVEAYEGERPINAGEEQRMVPAMTEKLDEDDKIVLDEEGEVVMVQDIDGVTGEPMMRPETGSYVRFGRVGLAYLNDEQTFARRWDTEAKAWVDLGQSELIKVRRAIRVARGESAPAVLSFPIRPEYGAE